jgi:hypothetical protein
MTRNGKIARLPREIRDELNRRLQNGEQGGPLLAWLNGLPQVRQVLAQDFDGSVISKQNLSEWRTGGFAEWQARQETLAQARELAADSNEITAVTDGKLTDHLATKLAVRYASVLANWKGETTEEIAQRIARLAWNVPGHRVIATRRPQWRTIANGAGAAGPGARENRGGGHRAF